MLDIDFLGLQRINPYEELEAMKLELADLPLLAAYLTDETFMPTYAIGHRGRGNGPLHPVNYAVADLVNQVAKHDLAQIDAYTVKDAEGKRKHLEDVLQWCRKHAAMGRAAFLLEVMAKTKDQTVFFESADEAVRDRVKGVVPILIKRLERFSDAESAIARLCYMADSGDAVESARQWLASDGPASRFWAALTLLRHGEKEKLEGLAELESVLAKDDGRLYLNAVEPLLTTRNERAMALACGVLAEKQFVVEYRTLRPIVQQLFLAGRQECLDYLLTKLDSERPIKKSPGVRDGKRVERPLVEGDRFAEMIAFWQGSKSEYDILALDADRRARRKELAAWLKGQFSLIKAGKKPDVRLEPPMTGVRQVFGVTPGQLIDSE